MELRYVCVTVLLFFSMTYQNSGRRSVKIVYGLTQYELASFFCTRVIAMTMTNLSFTSTFLI
jgi:hypothetical protein